MVKMDEIAINQQQHDPPQTQGKASAKTDSPAPYPARLCVKHKKGQIPVCQEFTLFFASLFRPTVGVPKEKEIIYQL